MSDITYSIVVPCYNSGGWLDELVSRVAAAMADQGSFEIILVNDKSPDGTTWPAIEDLARRHSFVRGIDMLYNVGQFKATLCGIDHARGVFVLTMDDDLQHPPEELPKLIEAMRLNPRMDCIMGRYLEKKHSILRNAGSLFVRGVMSRLYNKPSGVVTTSFRIMPIEFAKSVSLYRIGAPQLGPLIVSLTKRILNIPVRHEPRAHGSSGYKLMRLIKEALQSVINASIIPLRLFSLLGFATSAFAMMLGFFYLVRWFSNGIGVAGYASLILAISFFSGMILAGIGVLGEYIGRIIQEITGMPRYRVRAVAGDDDGQTG